MYQLDQCMITLPRAESFTGPLIDFANWHFAHSRIVDSKRYTVSKMSLTKNLRFRKSIDFKKLNDGDDLPRRVLTKRAVRVPATVLPDTYSVERIIERKDTFEVNYKPYHYVSRASYLFFHTA